jgi:hypothetical protein
MDPRGLRARLTGAGCTSCGAAILIDLPSLTGGPAGDDSEQGERA